MIYDDKQYVRQYSAEIRDAAVRAGMQRHAARTAPAPRIPITDGITIPTVDEAIHDLFMATARYYLTRAARGLAMSRDVSALLLAMHGAIHGSEDCVVTLNDALTYLVHSVASVEDTDVRNAIRAAQLSLKSLQSTWAEMPATTAEWHSQYWLRQ